MRETVKRIRETEKMLGTGEKKVEICEKECLASSRRSIVANKDISEEVKSPGGPFMGSANAAVWNRQRK